MRPSQSKGLTGKEDIDAKIEDLEFKVRTRKTNGLI